MSGTNEHPASDELLHAQQAVADAESGAAQTEAVITDMLSWADRIAQMHEENHYVNKLRTIFRGAHSA
ncbi:MAG: hypothetical protein K0S37_4619 [Microbacterium sp.]|jgi:hypothetical protein|nr:hypothetical protein [Microbacterium sp.]